MAFRRYKLASIQARIRREKYSMRDYFLGIKRDRDSSQRTRDDLRAHISVLEYSRVGGWEDSIRACRRTMQREQDVLDSIDYEIQQLLTVQENRDIFMRLKLEGLL